MKETIFNIYINSKNIDDKNIYFLKIKFELIKFKSKNVFNLFLHHVYMMIYLRYNYMHYLNDYRHKNDCLYFVFIRKTDKFVYNSFAIVRTDSRLT